MDFIDDIFSFVWDISDWFYDAYLTVEDWVWPFHYLSTPLYWVYRITWDMLIPIANLGDWIADAAERIGDILNWDAIRSLLSRWLQYAEDAWEWVKYAWENVTNVVTDWWAAVSLAIQGWIAIALETAKDLINSLERSLAGLQDTWGNFWTLTWPDWMKNFNGLATAWDNFWTVIFPTLMSATNTHDMIHAALLTWFPFYDSFIQIWNDMLLFFTSPFDWLKDKLEDWFWGGS